MKFIDICEVFEKLESTSKRLDKIATLSDFLSLNIKEAPLVFDLIAGNYQRESNKKTIGISLKTIFSVLAFLSNKSEAQIERDFNKIGDVGEVAIKVLEGNKQSSLASKSLTLEGIISAFEQISSTSGTNKNKIKKEILSKLFISSGSDLENKFLARLLIDDLRVGASEGVLREACVSSLFPTVIGIRSDESSLKEVFVDDLDSALKVDPKKNSVSANNPREIYNGFLSAFEKKYNTLNSFSKLIPTIVKDLKSISHNEIEIGVPVKSMLGVRTNTIEDSFKVTGDSALLDFKYDGLRVQIHNDKGKVKLFSRNLDDITKQFPEVVNYIKENFSNMSFILDSECVGYDFDKMQFLPFQILSRRILTKDVKSVSHIKVSVKAFDIFYLNGKTVMEEAYSKRREMLEELFLKKSLRQPISFDLEKLKSL